MSREQHLQIEARASTLRRQITAGASDRQAIGVELAKLLAAFPTQDPGVTASLRIEAYSDALGTAPAWAVREARLRVVRGEAVDSDGKPLDKRFAPTPPQLADLVRLIVKPLADDLTDLDNLAKVDTHREPNADERARVADGMDKLKGDLKTGIDSEGEDRRAGARETQERANARLLDRELAHAIKPMSEAAE